MQEGIPLGPAKLQLAERWRVEFLWQTSFNLLHMDSSEHGQQSNCAFPNPSLPDGGVAGCEPKVTYFVFNIRTQILLVINQKSSVNLFQQSKSAGDSELEVGA